MRVLAGGFFIEVLLAIVLIGGFAAASVDLAKGVSTTSAVIIGLGAFFGAFVVVWWLAHGIERHLVLHGLLMGVVATLLYLGMVAGAGQMSAALAAYGPATFVILNAARLLGAVLGGAARERRKVVRAVM